MWHRRLRNIAAAIAVPVILFGPIVMGAWHVRQAASGANSSAGPSAGDEQVFAYLSRRNPLVDRLLPPGSGGTVFSEAIDAAGTADARAGVITLRASSLTGALSEAVELHERAHLLFAFAAPEAARLMRGMAPPAPDQYAATNPGEHFAEMAAEAWTIVEPPDGFCPAQPPHDALRDAERRVPGTAGFVERYLREAALLEIDGGAELAKIARELTRDRRAEWDGLWGSVDARRRPDGTYAPWRHVSIRQYLQSQRDADLNTGGAFATFRAWVLTPSLMLVSIFQ